MIIAIHQPNFFPWYPFFSKVEKSDIFVILGHCQFEKNNYQNRFMFNNKWYTMSTNKGLEPICIKRYLTPLKDWHRIKSILKEYRDILTLFDDCISNSLLETNSKIIKKIVKLLQLETKIVFDYETDKKSTKRLVDICKHYNANYYLSGPSGRNYMDLGLFDTKNIDVIFHQTDEESKKPILEKLREIL